MKYYNEKTDKILVITDDDKKTESLLSSSKSIVFQKDLNIFNLDDEGILSKPGFEKIVLSQGNYKVFNVPYELKE